MEGHNEGYHGNPAEDREMGYVLMMMYGSMKESNNMNDLRGLVVHVYTKGT